MGQQITIIHKKNLLINLKLSEKLADPHLLKFHKNKKY